MTSPIKNSLNDAAKSALKQGRKQELAALRLVLAAVKQYEVDSRETADDPAVLQILTKLAKQRRESISQFAAAGRDDLVAQESFELELIESYLPAVMDPADVERAVKAAIAEVGARSPKDMGRVMGVLKDKLQGRADMGAVSGQIKAKLGG